MRATIVLILAGLACGAPAQPPDRPADPRAQPTIRDTEPRPVAATDDPVNRWVQASVVDGLVVVVTIDGASVQLDRATPARIPRAGATRHAVAGDAVSAVGYAGGQRIAEVSVPDQVLNAEEGTGLVRTTRRQIVLPLAAALALDTVEVSAPATNATARLDVRAAYATYCKAKQPDPRLCPPAARSAAMDATGTPPPDTD